MEGEIKGVALLGLAVFCPTALAVGAAAYVAGRVTGAAYRAAIREADETVQREFERVGGDRAIAAAGATTAIGEFLSPFTGGVSAVWMGVQASRIRKKTREAIAAQWEREQAAKALPPPPPPPAGSNSPF